MYTRILFKLSQKHWFSTDLSVSVSMSVSLSFFLLLHELKYWCVSVYTISVWDIWLWWINRQDVYCLQIRPVQLKKQKQTKKRTTTEMGWGTFPCWEGSFHLAVIDLGPSLLFSLSVPSHDAFVCHLLEEACSAADFTPSPSVLPSLNTSPWLWFITTRLLSPNPPVMLPVLTTPEIDDLSPRSRL